MTYLTLSDYLLHEYVFFEDKLLFPSWNRCHRPSSLWRFDSVATMGTTGSTGGKIHRPWVIQRCSKPRAPFLQVDSWTVYELHFYIDDICCLDGLCQMSDEILCDIRFEGVSWNRFLIVFCSRAIFAIEVILFHAFPCFIWQGTQVATGTIGLPFAQSESLQAWQRLTDGDLATVKTSKIFWMSSLDTMVSSWGHGTCTRWSFIEYWVKYDL